MSTLRSRFFTQIVDLTAIEQYFTMVRSETGMMDLSRLVHDGLKTFSPSSFLHFQSSLWIWLHSSISPCI